MLSYTNRLLYRKFNISNITLKYKTHCCKVLVVGGGTAGISIAARFSKFLCKNDVIIVEPQDVHYYQSCFTWIGAGVKTLQDSVQANLKVFPQNSIWLRDSVACFCPGDNAIVLESGHFVEYDVMVLALGVKMDFEEIQGLTEALDNYRNVSTIYSPRYVEKTFKSSKEFISGPALFTSPNTPVKCLSAPLKICYLAEAYLRKEDKLCEADFMFATADENLYPVKKYDDLLRKIAKRKRIDVHLKTNLIQVIPEKNQVVLECLDEPEKKLVCNYSLLHVVPPMSPPQVLQDSKELVDNLGYANVDLYTLRHKKFPNVYAAGDCSPGTKNKTTSAISVQTYTIFGNIMKSMTGKEGKEKYNGYTVCPIITGYGRCVLAEFDYNLKPCSSVPFWHGFESRLLYWIKRYILPVVYWNLLLKGLWNGTGTLRKILRLQVFSLRRKN
ncbi:hypothetical protein Trydic_g23503 [Trypoxylus dichotomus]